MQLLLAAVSVTLAIAGRSNSTPTIAADNAFVVVAWSATDAGGAADIFAAVSRDGARSFAAPVRVNDAPGDARVNGEQPPRIALVRRAADPAITVIWTTRGASGTRLVSSESRDGGRTFSRAVTVPQSDAASNRGWHNVAADARGRIHTIWLDHREMADHSMGGSPKHEHGGEKMDGAAMAQKSKLYVGTIDGSVPPHPVAAGVCYCCKTALAIGADGAIYAAWRHVYPGNLRDIAFSMSRDGGRTFAAPLRVSEDRWALDGCPDDGPAMAVDGRGRIHLAWPTLVADARSGEPTIAIFYSSSADGRSFAARTRLPTEGVAHHPQIVLRSDGTPLVAWDEGVNGTRRVAIAAGPSFARTIVSGGDRAVYPSIALSNRSVVAAWTSSETAGSVVRVQVVD